MAQMSRLCYPEEAKAEKDESVGHVVTLLDHAVTHLVYNVNDYD